MGDELSCRQAQNGVNFDFKVKFDLEGQGQSPPKTIGILTKVFYTYAPNLVILAWTGDELSRGQTWWRTDGRTDWRTDAGNDNTRRPILASGKNCCEIRLWGNEALLHSICSISTICHRNVSFINKDFRNSAFLPRCHGPMPPVSLVSMVQCFQISWHQPGRDNDTGLILGLRPANERRHYFVMASLIGWAQA